MCLSNGTISCRLDCFFVIIEASKAATSKISAPGHFKTKRIQTDILGSKLKFPKPRTILYNIYSKWKVQNVNSRQTKETEMDSQ